MQAQPLGQEDSLKEGMATHSSILAWRIPWTKEPGELRSMGLQRGGHDWSDFHWFMCIYIQIWYCGHSPRARYPEAWSQVGLRKNHYKAGRGDGIPVELFQILKGDAVKVLHSIHQQIWKLNGHRTGKINFHSNPKLGQCKRMLKLLHNCTYFTC